MKNVILVMAVVLLLPVSLIAQESKEFGPTKGDVSVELLFNPLPVKDNTQYFQMDEYKLKMRYFFNEKSALRLTVGLNMDVNNSGHVLEVPNVDDYSQDVDYERAKRRFDLTKNDKTSSTATKFSVAVGYEHHWMVAKRLDIFVGGDFGMGCTAYNALDVEYKALDYEYRESYVNTTRIIGSNFNNSRSSFNVLLAAVSGMDFYVYKGLYLGAELGLNLKGSSALGYRVVTTTTNPNVSVDKAKSVDKYRAFNVGAMNMAFSVTPLIRLGWLF